MKAYRSGRLQLAQPASGFVENVLNTLARFAAAASAYLVAYRSAQAAAHLHERLSVMSDADLERIGLTRGEICEQVRRRLDCGGS